VPHRSTGASRRSPNAGHVDLDKRNLIPFDELEELFTKNLAGKPDLAVSAASLNG
jgi:hypothetical protein